jgi:hypothetical protein
MSITPLLRIGVTGHRDVALGPAMLGRLRGALDGAFSALIGAQGETDDGRRRLQVVSGLAEGADRMVADAGLAHGAALVAVLPFPRAVYLEDFAEEQSKQDFMRLLAAATEVVELDGSTGSNEDRNAAYLAAGEAMVSRSDLVFALWDGRPANGPGGTGDIVTFARHHDCPVLWFKLDQDGEAAAEPVLLLTQRTISHAAVETLIAQLKEART